MTMVAMLVVVYFGIVGDTGNSCTWEGAVGCGAGEAPLPSRIESDKSKSGSCEGDMASKQEQGLRLETCAPVPGAVAVSSEV